jgi:hypothetical protein
MATFTIGFNYKLLPHTLGEKFKEAGNLYRKKVLARRELIIPPNPAP